MDTSRQPLTAIVNYDFSRIADYMATSYQADVVTLARLRTARVPLLKPHAHVRVVHGGATNSGEMPVPPILLHPTQKMPPFRALNAHLRRDKLVPPLPASSKCSVAKTKP